MKKGLDAESTTETIPAAARPAPQAQVGPRRAAAATPAAGAITGGRRLADTAPGAAAGIIQQGE